MSICTRCVSLPQPFAGPGWLHLQVVAPHTLSRLETHFAATGGRYERSESRFSIHESGTSLEGLLAALQSLLTTREQEDTRALFLPEGHDLTLDRILAMDTLAVITARIQGAWLPKLLADRRLYTEFHPIVSSADPRQVLGYECLARGRGLRGETISAGMLLQAAVASDALFQFDLAARRAAIQNAAAAGIASKVFINFTPTAIYDPNTCLRSTVAAAREFGLFNDQVVFEVIESEEVRDVLHLRRILDFYRSAGFGVALDDLGSGYGSLNLLHELRPDYVKIDMKLLRGIEQDAFKATLVRKLLEATRNLGLKTVAEGVEREEQFEWLREAGADFQQGYLFARPAQAPPNVIWPAARAATSA